MDNINSGAEYAQLLVNNILETESTISEAEQLPIGILTYWFKYINDNANINYTAYIMGNRESYMFTDVEMTDMFNKAGERYTGDLLDSMVDKDLLQVSVSEEGELLYGLSEKGKQYTDQFLNDK